MRLQNAVLKTSAFDSLGLPITVVHGTVDLLELRIPWASLQTSPIIVLVQNVNILLGPNMKDAGILSFSHKHMFLINESLPKVITPL